MGILEVQVDAHRSLKRHCSWQLLAQCWWDGVAMLGPSNPRPHREEGPCTLCAAESGEGNHVMQCLLDNRLQYVNRPGA